MVVKLQSRIRTVVTLSKQSEKVVDGPMQRDAPLQRLGTAIQGDLLLDVMFVKDSL